MHAIWLHRNYMDAFYACSPGYALAGERVLIVQTGPLTTFTLWCQRVTPRALRGGATRYVYDDYTACTYHTKLNSAR